MKCFACKKVIPEDSQFCPFCREPQGFDRGLIDAARAGDQGAVSELYRRTYENVYYTIRALIRDEDTVLDLVQDTFVKAFEHLDKLQDPAKFRAWVKRIGHNLAVDYTRRNRPMLFSQMTEEDSEQVLSFPDERPENLPDVALDRRETSRLVNEILGSLSEDQRLVVAMYYYEQRSVRQIAQELGVSENTVKSRLFQGRKKIETRVRALEAQGTRLYSLTPTAFLLLLLRNQELFVPPIPAEGLLSAVLGELGLSAQAAASAGSGAAAAEL
ncbi:MAG: RNA polymerase sigma factor, partial [Oscillospiraceae bacterium]|nr:RNA polymerase sigma factor [Oscillospiraceae bacterium]